MMRRVKVLYLVLILLFVFSSVAVTYAGSETYDTYSSPVRHYFHTATISNTTGNWSNIRDLNLQMIYYHVDTGATDTTDCHHNFYVYSSSGTRLTSKKVTYPGGTTDTGSFSGATTVKLRIYNPKYVNNGNVPWRLKTAGTFHGN